MHKIFNRRHFLQFGIFNLFLTSCSKFFGTPRNARVPYQKKKTIIEDSKALVEDPNGLIELPKGFSYKILQATNNTMTDNYKVPPSPAGMGLFIQSNGDYILMRNHLRGQQNNIPEDLMFDPENGTGSVTRITIDPITLNIKSSQIVSAGIKENSNGGITPWGWAYCENSTFSSSDNSHGYVFLISHLNEKLKKPIPLLAAGRFSHQSLAFLEKNYCSYMTEDRLDGLLYRLRPADLTNPFQGKLSALKIKSKPNLNMADQETIGEKWDIEWVDIDEVNPNKDIIRLAGFGKGAAIFSEAKGCFPYKDNVYFCCAKGGRNNNGQIFSLNLKTNQLELIENYTKPDNIFISNNGNIFISNDQLRASTIEIITANKKIQTFAKNVKSPYKFTGMCMSPDEKILFVNMIEEGLTIAITGPFKEYFSI